MLDIVVCVSGGGTNLQAIIDKIKSKEITNARIKAVMYPTMATMMVLWCSQ